MAGRTLYDRVRAAYDLEDVRNEAGQEGSSTCPLPPLPTERPPEASANSILVPFDPEEQSDDEVIITSAYERQNKTGKSSAVGRRLDSDDRGSDRLKTKAVHPASSDPVNGSRRDRAQNWGGTGYANRSKALSATAPPFQPQSSRSEIATIPLLDVAGHRGMVRDDVRYGAVYPGHRVGFCPWEIVKNYHIWFVGKQNSDRIRPYFQTGALLQCQKWDFCYLWHPAKEKANRHVLVVPSEQFQHLLERINKTLTIQLAIPPGANGENFRVIFGQQGTPIPRFLGCAQDASSLDALIKAMPPLHPEDAVYELAHIKHQAQEMYLKKVSCLLHKYEKGDRKKNKSEKAQKKRFYERQRWGKQIKRIQRYFGLRGKAGKGPVQGNASITGPQALDLSKPMPHTQEDDVIFVSMDIESYEFNHSVVTEIGFGILDTRDLAGAAPGLCCENWHALIRGRHFRIREHAAMVNRTFVHGCESNFNFGQTEFVRVKDVLAVITQILQPRLANGRLRNIVLVGHDIKSDISLVENVGFHVDDGMFLEIVDTQDLHQHFRMLGQRIGLRGVLNELEIEHCFLHNGGNDAVYTLQAMISLVVTKRQDSLRRQNERLQPNYKPDPEIIQQGWDTGGEISDGGYPKRETEVEVEENVGERATACATPSSSTTVSQSKNTYYEASPVSKSDPAAVVMTDEPEDLIEF